MHVTCVVALARPARVVAARWARMAPRASSSATAKWLPMPVAPAPATFQATVTGPAVWKRADSSALGLRAVPLSLTSTTERGVSAATRALQGVALELLGDHLSHCVQDALASGGPDAQAKVDEATAAIERLVRS